MACREYLFIFFNSCSKVIPSSKNCGVKNSDICVCFYGMKLTISDFFFLNGILAIYAQLPKKIIRKFFSILNYGRASQHKVFFINFCKNCESLSLLFSNPTQGTCATQRIVSLAVGRWRPILRFIWWWWRRWMGMT